MVLEVPKGFFPLGTTKARCPHSPKVYPTVLVSSHSDALRKILRVLESLPHNVTATNSFFVFFSPGIVSAEHMESHTYTKQSNGRGGAGPAAAMVTPLVKHDVIKKRVKKFKRMQSDRKISVKENWRRPKGIDSQEDE